MQPNTSNIKNINFDKGQRHFLKMEDDLKTIKTTQTKSKSNKTSKQPKKIKIKTMVVVPLQVT